ncbi:hypothetical protein HCN44_007875 [Aphidius gifuensis]|uniref:Uncharacterized protein n=1 Tax=Aphidius gifuensis TaxID=684658 RepID=A0A834XVL4_APHGI|nr:keratin-associated protein 10-12-like [Aphidius gifuensis]KAF7993372.1 hypothetical protein HCN44_007875 [Aphidius gifuensis]
MGSCKKNSYNVMDEISKLICEMDCRKPEPECCNISCPPLGCPQGPCPGMCTIQRAPDPCCVSKMPKSFSCKPTSQCCVPSPCFPTKKYCLTPAIPSRQKTFALNCQPPCCPPVPQSCEWDREHIKVCYPTGPSCCPTPCCPAPLTCVQPQKQAWQMCCPTTYPKPCPPPCPPPVPSCPLPRNLSSPPACSTYIVSIPPR